MSSLAKQEGYLLVDNRGAGEGMTEFATVTCCHCQRTWIKNPQRTRERGYCAKCNGYVCDNPGCHAECRPFWKTLDEELTRIINETPRGA